MTLNTEYCQAANFAHLEIPLEGGTPNTAGIFSQAEIQVKLIQERVQHFKDALLIEPRIDIDSSATSAMPTH